MAVQEHRGWVWTPEEKAWTKTWQRELQTEYNRVSEQVQRFKQSVPAFAEEAATTAQLFLDSSSRLLSLSKGVQDRKYQNLSPEEAESTLRASRQGQAAWTDFLMRPDVQDAIRIANRTERAKKRQGVQQQRANEQAFVQHINSPDFLRQFERSVQAFVDAVPTAAMLDQALAKYGNANDTLLLERLFLVHFVRIVNEGNTKRAEEIRQFVTSRPTPSMREVIFKVMLIMFKYHRLQGSLVDFQTHIAGYHNEVVRRVLATLQKWRENGISPKDIPIEYFRLCSVDYSLAAQPT